MLRGPRAKIERAKKHILDFETALGDLTFSNTTHPHVIVIDDDLEPDKKSYKISDLPAVPDWVTTIGGDAIHNMRSALDLLIAELIERNGQKPGKVYFPTGWKRKDFVSRCKSEIEGRVGQDAFDLIWATEAHRGGKGDALWHVHRLDVEDKHRILYTLAFNFSAMTLAFPRWEGELPADSPFTAEDFDASVAEMMGNLFFQPANNMLPLEKGDVLFYGPPNPTNDPKFRLGVAFSEPDIVKGKTVLPALIELCEKVEGTVEAFAPLLEPAI